MGKTGLIPVAGVCAAALAGCATTQAEADPCMSGQYAYLIGRMEGAARVAQLPAPHRIYSEGDMITMDFNPERLNVVLDGDGVITELKCG